VRRYRVEFSPAADRHVERIQEWWVANRPKAPGLLRREVAVAIRQLSRAPETGVLYDGGEVPSMRRLLLPRTRHHIYFTIDEPAPRAGARRLACIAGWRTTVVRTMKCKYKHVADRFTHSEPLKSDPPGHESCWTHENEAIPGRGAAIHTLDRRDSESHRGVHQMRKPSEPG